MSTGSFLSSFYYSIGSTNFVSGSLLFVAEKYVPPSED